VTCTGLTDGNSYTLTLTSTSGSNTYSNVVSGVISFTNPDPPTSVTATVQTSPAGESGNGQVQVKWNAPAATGGFPIASYNVSLVDDSNQANTSGGCQQPSGESARSTICTGLTKGDHYSFSVESVTTPGVKSLSKGSSSSTLVYGAPAAPTQLTIATNNENNDGKVTLSWTDPTDLGGNPNGISSYIISYASGNSNPTTTTLRPDQNPTTCPGQPKYCYTFVPSSVIAPTWSVTVNNGFDSPSASLQPPGAPKITLATGAIAGENSVKVSWVANPAATNYRALAWPAGSGLNPSGSSCTTATTTCTITGLNAGISYFVAVEASSGSGFTNGDSITWGFSLTSATAIRKPSAPSNLQVSVDGLVPATMSVSWDADTVTSAGGSQSWSYVCTLNYDDRGVVKTVATDTAGQNQPNCSFTTGSTYLSNPVCPNGIYLG
jgi:hypothetical protein